MLFLNRWSRGQSVAIKLDRANVGNRFNLSRINEDKDVTTEIEKIMQGIVHHGLRFARDLVIFRYDGEDDRSKNDGIIFVDKDLTQEDIEQINRYFIGVGDLQDTQLARMAEILANKLLQDIGKVLDKNPKHVIVTIHKMSFIKYLNKPGKLGYGWIRTSGPQTTLETEMCYTIEEVKREEEENGGI